MEIVAKKNFNFWNEALLSKDPKKVVALYTEDVTFLPTLSSDFKMGKSGAEEYFIHFLEKNPEGKIIAEKVQKLSENSYSHSGLYDFEVDNEEKEGERKVVRARFTFVWEKDKEGKWKIIHHHSSLLP